MNFFTKTAPTIIIALLLLSGCVGTPKSPPPKIDYYTLEYTPPVKGDRSMLPVLLGVQRFQAAPDYLTNRIIYRDNLFRRNAYTYHKWRATPGDLVTYFLARDLQHSAMFKAVFTTDRKLPVTHIIEGAVDEFFEYDDDRAWQAMLSVSITLLKASEPDITQRVIFQKRYRSQKPCRYKNPQALAEAMSEAMSELSHMIANDIYRFLAAYS